MAIGQVSADDYRRERDRILAAASGNVTSAPAAAPVALERPSDDQGNPFPAPFKWSAERPGEHTQVVAPGQQPPAPHGNSSESDSDRTQVVSNAAAHGDSTQAIHQSERTQVVSAQSNPEQTQIVRPVQQPNQHSAPLPQWNTNVADQSVTPWGDADQQLPWMGFHAQGPEVFEDDTKSGGKLWVILGVVVVVALIAAGVVYFTMFRNTGNTPPPAPSTSAVPTTTTKPKPKPYGPLIVPEGRTSGPKTYTAEQLSTAKPLPTPDLVLLKQAGVTEARSVIVVPATTTTSLWSFTAADPAALLTAIETDQKRFGFAEAADAGVASVKVFASQQTSTTKTIFVFRAHYVSGSEVIRVEAYDTSESEAKAKFTAVLQAQIDHNPPK
ncbi:hypothetical protein [Actinokineospora sp.]|uniref:hypothetical protein n=1 Tax=Actinokineospora sp. TaxID=1872133 RepID=UPI003D6B7919